MFPWKQDAPLNICLQMTDCSAEEQYAMRLLKLGISFKALNASGKILGVFINGKMSKNVREKHIIPHQFA